MVFVHQYSRRGQNPAPIVWNPKIESVAQIVIGSTSSFLGVPNASPTENLARHISVEFPLLLFLLLVHTGSVELASDIVGRVHVGLVERAVNLVIPVLGHVKRGL